MAAFLWWGELGLAERRKQAEEGLTGPSAFGRAPWPQVVKASDTALVCGWKGTQHRQQFRLGLMGVPVGHRLGKGAGE